MNIAEPPPKGFNLPFLRHRGTAGSVRSRRLRLPGLNWLGDSARNHFVALLGEFVGTFLFLFFAFTGTQVANMSLAAVTSAIAPEPNVLLYIALSFGFSLAVNAWVFFRISGGLFNPAVTFGLCLVGAVGWVRGAVDALAQIIGGIAAAGVVSALFPGPLLVQTDLSISPVTSLTRGVFIEMFLTAQLVFTIFMLAAEKHKGTFLAPVGIGLSLFVAELAGVYWTGGSLNPARSFGPAVVSGFKSNHWVYWVGPALGALLAAVFYRLVKILEFETANPGQDDDRKGSVAVSKSLPTKGNGTANGTLNSSDPSSPTNGHFGADPLGPLDKSDRSLMVPQNPMGSDLRPDSRGYTHASDAEMGQVNNTSHLR